MTPRLLGSPRSPRAVRFRPDPARIFTVVVQAASRGPTSPSRHRSRSPLQLLSRRDPEIAAPHSSVGPARPHQEASTHVGVPIPTSFRPQALSASRRLTPPPGSQVCFALQPNPGPVPFRGLTTPSSCSSMRNDTPLPLADDTTLLSKAPSRRPRLRGLDPLGATYRWVSS